MPEPMPEQMPISEPINYPDACFTVVNICEAKSMMGGHGMMMGGY
jgi:hypothetical protein